MSEGLWDGDGTFGEPDSESHTRQLLWELFTAGMSAFIYLRNGSKGLSAMTSVNFFTKSGVKWWELTPHDELISSGNGYCLAKLGSEYVVFSGSGSRFSFNLPANSYSWRWFNPQTGIFNETSRVTVSAGQQEFLKPDSFHWVLHLRLDVGPPPTSPTTPGNLVTTSVSTSRVDLSWDSPEAPGSTVSFYNIFRDGENVGVSLPASYSDQPLLAGRNYQYQVSAVAATGAQSPKSASVIGTPTPRSGLNLVGPIHVGEGEQPMLAIDKFNGGDIHVVFEASGGIKHAVLDKNGNIRQAPILIPGSTIHAGGSGGASGSCC